MTRTRSWWASTLVALVAGALVATSGIHAQEAETTENQPRDSEATRRDESSTTRQAQEDQNQSERERAQREQREQSERQRREREQREQQDQASQRTRRSQEDTRTQEDQARSRTFDEDPRERDRSFSRYPDDPRAPDARDRRAADAQRDPRAGREEQGREEQGRGAWLGVYLAENQQQNGALVRSVYPAGPAARAGFRSGDIIVSVDGQRVSDASEVMQIVDRMDPRAQAEFVVLRGGQQVALNTRLGDRQAFVVQQEEFGGRQQSGRRYSNQPEEQDDFASVPPYAMELEHHRRMAEQHQRLEEAIDRLHQEVRQLREELRSARGTDSGRRQ